jgi:hypothetical protein
MNRSREGTSGEPRVLAFSLLLLQGLSEGRPPGFEPAALDHNLMLYQLLPKLSARRTLISGNLVSGELVNDRTPVPRLASRKGFRPKDSRPFPTYVLLLRYLLGRVTAPALFLSDTDKRLRLGYSGEERKEKT